MQVLDVYLTELFIYDLNQPFNYHWKVGTRTKEDWKLRQFSAHDLIFYCYIYYSASKRSFILYVFLPDDVESASKYTAKITVSPNSLRKLIYEGPVLSIEGLPTIYNSQAYNKYWIASYESMMPFIKNQYFGFLGWFDGLQVQVQVFEN